MRGVYPRAYGETKATAQRILGTTGLSPRLRGNLPRIKGVTDVTGSIPAPTGKPSMKGRRSTPTAVYPRAYGETIASPST